MSERSFMPSDPKLSPPKKPKQKTPRSPRPISPVTKAVILAGAISGGAVAGRTHFSKEESSNTAQKHPRTQEPANRKELSFTLGFGESWKQPSMQEYQRLFLPDGRPWREAVRRCLRQDGHGHIRYIQPIEDAGVITHHYYPDAFIAGLVVHESRCREEARTGDGGVGFAQITPTDGRIDARWWREATRLLGHEPDYEHNPVDNIVLGLTQLRITEQTLGSRELGLAGYNAGIEGVRRAMRASGWHEGDPLPSLHQVHAFLPHRAHKWDARFYAGKVLASALLAERIRLGVSVSRLPHLPNTIRMQDFPGAIVFGSRD